MLIYYNRILTTEKFEKLPRYSFTVCKDLVDAIFLTCCHTVYEMTAGNLFNR